MKIGRERMEEMCVRSRPNTWHSHYVTIELNASGQCGGCAVIAAIAAAVAEIATMQSVNKLVGIWV